MSIICPSQGNWWNSPRVNWTPSKPGPPTRRCRGRGPCSRSGATGTTRPTSCSGSWRKSEKPGPCGSFCPTVSFPGTVSDNFVFASPCRAYLKFIGFFTVAEMSKENRFHLKDLFFSWLHKRLAPLPAISFFLKFIAFFKCSWYLERK